MSFEKKEVGKCTCCGCQLLRKPQFNGDTWFPEDSVRVDLAIPAGGFVSVDLCGHCANECKEENFEVIAECLKRAMIEGLEKARDAEIEALCVSLSTAEKRISFDEAKAMVDSGRVQLQRWTNRRVLHTKAQINNMKVLEERGRIRHVDLGPPMMQVEISVGET